MLWKEQGWRSDESGRLPPMWSRFDLALCHKCIWAEFVVGSRLAPRVFLHVRQFSSLQKTNTRNSNSTRIEDPLENQQRLMWSLFSILRFIYRTALISQYPHSIQTLPTFPRNRWSFTQSTSGLSDDVVLQMLLFLGLRGKLQINMTGKLSKVPESFGPTANAVSTESKHCDIVLLIWQESPVHLCHQHHPRQHRRFSTNKHKPFRDFHGFVIEVSQP